MRISASRFGVYFYYFLLLTGLGSIAAQGGWESASVGLPPISVTSAKDMGADTQKSALLQDKLGRIFIGSTSLLVFDGQGWRSYMKPGSYFITALALGPPGIIWAGMPNDLGFFQETTPGEFKFHSLRGSLPADARNVGTIWACASVGSATYFVGRDKVLRWDGRRFEVSSFSAQYKLSPVKLGDELWFHHLESGLYRLGESGPELKFSANQLPTVLILGLFRDEHGLVSVSNDGLVRLAEHPTPHSPKSLNTYLTQHKVSAFGELPNGNLIIGTLSGGLVLTDRQGNIVRTWSDAGSGLPGRIVVGIAVDASGEVFGLTPTDFFHFPASGHASVFNVLNGLRGEAVSSIIQWKSTLYAATENGVYHQVTDKTGNAVFEPIPSLNARYNDMLAFERGLLLARAGAVDWFDGTSMRLACELPANSAYLVAPSALDARTFYVAEVGGISRLVFRPDGSFERIRFLELTDSAVNMHEDTSGQLWIGTMNNGALRYDPTTNQLSPVLDPTSGEPLQGRVQLAGDRNRILFFLRGRLLTSGPLGQDLHAVSGLPWLDSASIRALPGGERLLVSYARPISSSGPLHGAGILSFDQTGAASWKELDLSSLDAIGSIRTIACSQENQREILWLGGMEGILRLDLAAIPNLAAPAMPIIKAVDAGEVRNGTLEYPFRDHHIRFWVFTGDYLKSRNWTFQTRLGKKPGDWSAPASRRFFEYTNLSEGTYQFEIRAINPAGVAGPSSSFRFTVLPPWYRSNRAYAAYAIGLALAVVGFIRIRERRIRARNQELETLVGIRTAELVKANAAKDEFLAGISHEIRNPMNGVIGIAENFRTDNLDGENRRKFNLLRQCASHLSSLLEDILDFSKVQAGAIELDPKPFDLPELVESVAGITRADSEKYGIPVELAISPAVPRKLVGDARRIRQILINFVSNALKFSGRGQVSVTVWCKPAAAGQTEVVFAVSDEGPGISPEEQARLFTRFERGAAAQKGRVPGTGLGLALCKGLAEKMGGRIWLESEPGRGSCFYFSAPFPVIEEAVEAAVPAAPPAAAGARSALVVDDQEYNRIVLADLLQSMGFAVHATQEGQAALEAAARQAFDVVFLDFNLPGLNGVDVARAIRSSGGPSAHALILATTAFTTPEKRAQCLDAGMDAFLGKPVTRERLAKALSSLAPAAAGTPRGPATPPASNKSAGPADGLVNLRLLARKKGVPVAQELELYFAEMEAELALLDTAIQTQDAIEAARVSHMLCGRCSFIFERELEQVQRKVEAAVGAGRWPEARRHRAEFGTALAGVRLRLSSSGRAVPPA